MDNLTERAPQQVIGWWESLDAWQARRRQPGDTSDSGEHPYSWHTLTPSLCLEPFLNSKDGIVTRSRWTHAFPLGKLREGGDYSGALRGAPPPLLRAAAINDLAH